MYQLPWIENKLRHVYNQKLQDGLCEVFVLLDQNLGSKLLGKFVKNLFQDVGKSEKITKHETKEYHKDASGKPKEFLESYEDPTNLVTHDKNSDEKYERNTHFIKIITEAVLLCAEQGIAVRGHREQDSSNGIEKNSDTARTMQKGNFLAIINTFST